MRKLIDTYKPLYEKYRETIAYLFFGGFSFLIAFCGFFIFRRLFGMRELTANALSWVLSVSFAFFTNRKWVFRADRMPGSSFFGQLCSFFSGRLFTLATEELLLYLLITKKALPDLPVKFFTQMVVTVLNYIISKWIVFRKKKTK